MKGLLWGLPFACAQCRALHYNSSLAKPRCGVSVSIANPEGNVIIW